ncbi:hypothetical protein SAMN05216359_112139 [Roseateles sp. YR242]|nr:hypothetical protein SAMN05216359_112139 [Roseateles sp. YR242]
MPHLPTSLTGTSTAVAMEFEARTILKSKDTLLGLETEIPRDDGPQRVVPAPAPRS